MPSTISIHALREEGDPFRDRQVNGFDVISIHALREEGDYCSAITTVVRYISIHALREEGDGRCTCVPTASLHFYPRPPRGGRQLAGKHEAAQEHFYPRPPRGGRLPVKPKRRGDVKFLSTPSARRATSRAARLRARNPISIHALREEGDPLSSILMGIALSFLSTPSARRAT